MNYFAILAFCIALYIISLIVKFLKFRGRFKLLPLTKIVPIFQNTKGSNCDPLTIFLQVYVGLSKLFYREGLVLIWILIKPLVILFNAENAEALLTSQKTIDKSSDYTLLTSWLGTGLLTSQTKKWRHRRKMLTPSFHFRILDQFQPIINEHVKVTINKLAKANDTSEMDLLEVLGLLGLDIIGETSLGINFEAQGDKDQSEYLTSLKIAADCFFRRLSNLWLYIDFVYNRTTNGGRFKKAVAIMQAVTKKVVRERKLNFKRRETEENEGDVTKTKTRLALLDLLLEEHFKDPLAFTEEDVREEVDTFVFAAHDTTSATVLWALYLLGLHPEIQERVVEELLSIFPEGMDKNITLDELKEMKYLDCVIKESQRLYTPVPMIGRTISEDINIGGNLLPKGAECWVLISCLHKDPKVYPNPEVFDPDNFSPERIVGRNPFSFIPFSAGPRNCIGQRFALMVVKTTLSRLINSFQIESLDPPDKIPVKTEMILKPDSKMRIRLTRRTGLIN